MKKIFFLACLLPLLSLATSRPPLDPNNADNSIDFAPVSLHLDPEVSTFRVPPPANFGRKAVGGTANIQINFLPAGSSEALWDDNPIAWPNDAKAAFQYAANVWESQLNSSVPITVNVAWVDNLSPGVLGHGGPLNGYKNFSNAPQADTYYPVALANSIAGFDLDAAQVDIYIAFSSSFSWYTGTDGNPSSTQSDLASVSIHELCHGLGFLGRMTVSDDEGSCPYIFIYDRFTEDATANSLLRWLDNPTYLGSLLRSGALYFDGANANVANGGQRVPIYAPSAWNPGSSYSHLDESFNDTPNALMTWSISRGTSIHSPGPVVFGMFEDMGWNDGVAPPTTHTVSLGSLNPSSAVTIGYASTGNSGTCSTPDSVEFDDNSSVTFTAPDIVDGNAFEYWQKDGGVTFANQEISLSITADTSLVAVYASAISKHTVSLSSLNPSSGVTITYSSALNSGSCSTPNSVDFADNSSVTFTAPVTAGGNAFDYWQKDGGVTFANREISLSITAATSLVAVYETDGAECKITLKSQNPNSGVTMTVSPADNYGNTAADTSCEFYYPAGTAFALSTPEIVGENSFSHWDFDGYLIYSRNVNVTINGNITLTAVYANGIPGLLDISKISGSIAWNDKISPGIGSISLKGSLLSPVTDLSSLDGQWLHNLFTVNASSYILDLESGSFKKINKKATSVQFFSKSGKSKIMAKLKLKNGMIYFTFKGVRGNNVPDGLDISNSDTDGWVNSTVHVTLNAGPISGAADVPFRYSTKANKKSKIK